MKNYGSSLQSKGGRTTGASRHSLASSACSAALVVLASLHQFSFSSHLFVHCYPPSDNNSNRDASYDAVPKTKTSLDGARLKTGNNVLHHEMNNGDINDGAGKMKEEMNDANEEICIGDSDSGRRLDDFSWIQMGQNLEGNDTEGFMSGMVRTLSLSSDGMAVAVGAVFFGDQGGSPSPTLSGRPVRVFDYDESTIVWSQRPGGDVPVIAAQDEKYNLNSVSMSHDGSVVAVGSSTPGDVRVYGYDTGDGEAGVDDEGRWVQIGSNIVSNVSEILFGYDVSLSENGTIVAVSDNLYDISGQSVHGGMNTGNVQVFKYEPPSSWKLLGQVILGDEEGMQFGTSVSLSSDGTIVAVGAPTSGGGSRGKGAAFVYAYNGTRWNRRGQPIVGEFEGDQSGTIVSLSSDGNTVAVGAPSNPGQDSRDGKSAGHVRVHEFDTETNTWNSLGSDINGANSYELAGTSLAMSGDATHVAVGAPRHDGSTGHVRVFQKNDTNADIVTWNQVDQDMYGDRSGAEAGTSVSISGNGQTVAVGTPYHMNDKEQMVGLIQVYRLQDISASSSPTFLPTVSPTTAAPTTAAPTTAEPTAQPQTAAPSKAELFVPALSSSGIRWLAKSGPVLMTITACSIITMLLP